MAKPPPEHTVAFVVGHTAFGESDKIVRLLTPTHGLLHVMAKRARKSQKKYGGALDIGQKIEAGVRTGSGDLWHIDEANLLDAHLGARARSSRLHYWHIVAK